jgi:hypothetical protein
MPAAKEISGPECQFVIYDRAAYIGACDLIKIHGAAATIEALHKADFHERRGENQQSHYWRRVESAIEVLLLDKVTGAIH